jgi:hypothetical protein
MRGVLLTAMLLLVACGADATDRGVRGGAGGGAGSPPADDRTAIEKCESFVDVLCNNTADCGVELECPPVSTRQEGYDACVSGARGALPCDEVDRVDSRYAACIQATGARPCSDYGSRGQCEVTAILPVCNGIFIR